MYQSHFYICHLKKEILCMPRERSENLLLASQQFKNTELTCSSCINEFAFSSYSTPEITLCKVLERQDIFGALLISHNFKLGSNALTGQLQACSWVV